MAVPPVVAVPLDPLLLLPPPIVLLVLLPCCAVAAADTIGIFTITIVSVATLIA